LKERLTGWPRPIKSRKKEKPGRLGELGFGRYFRGQKGGGTSTSERGRGALGIRGKKAV